MAIVALAFGRAGEEENQDESSTSLQPTNHCSFVQPRVEFVQKRRSETHGDRETDTRTYGHDVANRYADTAPANAAA
jgi:hypothetical protein